MKKLLLVISLFSLLYIAYTKEYNMSEDMIRFRVIASSNTNRDIMMKELVVKELSSVLFIKSNDIDDVRNNIYNNMELIDKRINKLFKKHNYNKKYNILYGINDFPQKTFLGKTYKSGSYESLVIEIGEAKGNNYFCILYPSLCMIDYEKQEENNKEYGFKIIEFIKGLSSVKNRIID